jgi:hypothetical protein
VAVARNLSSIRIGVSKNYSLVSRLYSVWLENAATLGSPSELIKLERDELGCWGVEIPLHLVDAKLKYLPQKN